MKFSYSFLIVSLIFIFSLSGSYCFAQENGVLELKGLVEEFTDDYEPLRGVEVSMKTGGEEVKNIKTDREGVFDLEMEVNNKYTIEFSKEDYVSKKIFVDAIVPEGEDGTWTVEFSITLFKMYPGLDVSALEDPVTKIVFFEREGGFDYDRRYTEKMMAKIDRIMDQLEKLKEEAYREIIRKGDDNFDDENYEQAINYYQEALDQRPGDRYPKKQIKEARKLLEEYEERQTLYEEAVARADELFNSEEYEESKEIYYEAISYDKKREYPREQIRKIDDILKKVRAERKEQEEKQEKYEELVRKGDKNFEGEEYRLARQNYQDALGIFSEKSYPKEQINKIEDLLAEQAEQQELNENYNALIEEADRKFSDESYSSAKAGYMEALELKPSESYPKEQIEKIENILAERKATEEEYSRLIRQADQAFSSEEYQGALDKYKNALEIKPGKQHPENRIDSINSILEEQQKKRENYTNLVEQADQRFDSDAYNQAKELYTEALFIKPDEQYPKDQISKIDDILEQKQKEEQARKEKAEKYDEAVEKGDAMFAMEEYEQAKRNYQEALNIKPGEDYPENKINEINSILNKLEEQEQEYRNAIAEADSKFDTEKYEESKNLYTQAQEIKPDKNYPKKQINKIEDILARKEAERREQQELTRKYNDAVNTADQLFSAEEYEDSKVAYQEALKIKPEEEYPEDQIDKIEEILAEKAAAKERAYSEAIRKADDLRDNKQYEEAKQNYSQALSIRPDENYPKEEIEKIDNILADMAEKREEEERTQRMYDEEINKADNYFSQNAYYDARKHYQNALEYKPGETYPKKRLSRIEEILAEFEAAKKEREEREKKQANQDKEKDDSEELQSFSDFDSKEEEKKYLNSLAEEYPQGVTVENYEFERRTVKRVIVNYEGKATEYRKVKHSWGGTYYFRNGQTISQAVFNVETKERD
ncbi:MAG: hypothetical protein ACOCZ4_01230 [Bacteroidota bacterium]